MEAQDQDQLMEYNELDGDMSVSEEGALDCDKLEDDDSTETETEGSIVTDEADAAGDVLDRDGAIWQAAKGGRGGRGNLGVAGTKNRRSKSMVRRC